MASLSGKVAVVTGASRGIGKGIALALASEGATVYVTGRTVTPGSSPLPGTVGETAARCNSRGGMGIAVPVDHGRDDQVAALFAQIEREQGRLDILVNNAGVLSAAPFLELSSAEFRRIFQVNVFGLAHASQIAARQMAAQGTGGAILNVSSLNAATPFRNTAHYSASKAAVSSLTRSLALELATHRIRVNELCPASVETGMNRKSMQDPESRRIRLDTIPLRRIGQPEDLAGAAVFLCSDEAAWITGASLATDGGLGLVPPLGGSVSRY